MISEKAKTAIVERLGTFANQTNTFYGVMKLLVKGECELSQENIKELEASLSGIEKNVNETRSILARLRELEKQVRCLEQYAHPDNSKEESDD